MVSTRSVPCAPSYGGFGVRRSGADTNTTSGPFPADTYSVLHLVVVDPGHQQADSARCTTSSLTLSR